MRCFHCHEPLGSSTLVAHLAGRRERVCCAGCLAVAELVANGGLNDYYTFRTAPGERPTMSAQSAGAAYADEAIAAQFLRRGADRDGVLLVIDGMRCAACAWLIEHVVQRIPGVVAVQINAATGRAHIEWRRSHASLPLVLDAIAQLGYRPQPLNANTTSAAATDAHQHERREGLKQLLVSAFGMMQVMMFAWASYSAQINGEQIEPALLEFFRLVSMLVATPVLFYAGAPILRGAWNNIRLRTIGMDAPVGAALVLAYAASVWNTFIAHGEVYFDSVTMFIFFLSLGRFVTMSVRRRTTSVMDALARQLPAVAHRVTDAGVEETPLIALKQGDRILVRPGEVIPVDGDLLEGATSVDESLMTGESSPVRRDAGERLLAGALNVGNPVVMRAVAIGSETAVSHIAELVQRAQTLRPAAASSADRVARRFLLGVLLAAAATCVGWLAVDSSRAFEATLAVLVVACPCAFAIATPAALSAATARLATCGVLTTRPDALEALTQIDTIVFDKTGTLTRGEAGVLSCTAFAQMSQLECLRVAAALEQGSAHPLARAFASYHAGAVTEDAVACSGKGVQGVVDGRRFRVGELDYVAALSGTRAPANAQGANTLVYLGDQHGLLARFEIEDALRPEAAAVVLELRRLGVAPQVLSGDHEAAVATMAARAGVEIWRAHASPQDKLEHVRNLQRQGRRVAMVGDGVNDAPVLGAADVSIAMGRGAALAHASADFLLVREDLTALVRSIDAARRALKVAHQNLYWSAAYNLASLPLAALGYIPPWLAAFGMSISSIAVVLNSVRLAPKLQVKTPHTSGPEANHRVVPPTWTPRLLRRSL